MQSYDCLSWGIMFNSGIKIDIKDFDKLDINPRERTDQVDVRWK